MEWIQVPFHFTSTFVVTIAAAGALLLALRRPQYCPTGRLARRSFLAGWALLLLAELGHGSLVASTELDPRAVALRGGAYAFLVLALLPASRRARESRGHRTDVAQVAVTPSLAFMPIVLSIAAALFSLRSRLPGARRLTGALTLLAISELLFGIGGATTDAAGGTLWSVAHTVRLLGGLMVGSWLWGAFRTSIQVRFIAAYVALMLIVVIALSSAMTQVFASNVRRNALEQSTLEGRAQSDALDEQRDELIRLSKIPAELTSIRQDLARGNQQGLQETATVFQAPGGLFESLDFIAFLNASGTILAVSDIAPAGGSHLGEVDKVGLAGTDVVQVALQQRIEAGSIDAIGASSLAVVAASPVFNPPGMDAPGAPQGLAGAVVVGVEIDFDYVVTIRGEDLEFSVITPKQVLVSTLFDSRGLFNADLPAVFERGDVTTAEATLGVGDYFSAYVPLERTDEQVVGALVVSRLSAVLDLTQANVGQTLFTLALVAAGIAVISSYYTGARITRPIVDLTGAAQRVREGDLDARAPVQVGDEVGTLSETFNEMIASIGQLTGDLRGAATQLQTILQSLTDGVVAVDDQGAVVAFNREAERLTGKSRSEVTGRMVQDVLVATDGSGSALPLAIYELKSGSVSNAFIGRDAASGAAVVQVAITSAPIRDEDGDVLGAVAVVRDLSSEIALERAKTEFLSNISHELNTPLTPIRGYAEMLRRRPVTRKKSLTMLDGILASTNKLKRIVDMLIDVSSMEAGRLTLRRREVDLVKVTGEIIERWKTDAPKHRFERKGFRGLPRVEVDPRLLPRALDELVDNAVKFSPKGGLVSLTAEVGRSRGTKSLRLSVADRGIGISKEKLAEIFEEFTQVDASTTRAFGGLGLGLAYVRRVVDAHGGQLEVESTPKKGSRFSIILPVENGRSRTASTRRRAGSIPKKRK